MLPTRSDLADRNAELAQAYQQGDSQAGETLLQLNEGLIGRVARKYFARHPHALDLEDLRQEARIGLLRAAEVHDPARGAFSTVAVWWMEQTCRRAIDNTGALIRIPVNQRYLSGPRPEAVLALDRRVGGDQEDRFGELLEDPASVGWEDGVLTELQLAAAMGRLEETERTVIVQHFGLDAPKRSLRAIAEDLGYSPEWTRRTEARALGRLKRALAG